MGKHERRVYLEAIRKRYRRARRSDKSKILDEFCSVCGYQRKYAIRLLGSKLGKSPRRPGAGIFHFRPMLILGAGQMRLYSNLELPQFLGMTSNSR